MSEGAVPVGEAALRCRAFETAEEQRFLQRPKIGASFFSGDQILIVEAEPPGSHSPVSPEALVPAQWIGGRVVREGARESVPCRGAQPTAGQLPSKVVFVDAVSHEFGGQRNSSLKSIGPAFLVVGHEDPQQGSHSAIAEYLVPSVARHDRARPRQSENRDQCVTGRRPQHPAPE